MKTISTLRRTALVAALMLASPLVAAQSATKLTLGHGAAPVIRGTKPALNSPM